MSNGKGSSRRPMQIPPEEFDQRWTETFGDGTDRVDSIAAAYRELWRRFKAEPVYGASVLGDPDIIAEQLERNREAREYLDRLADAYPDRTLTGRVLRPRSGPLVSVTDVIHRDPEAP